MAESEMIDWENVTGIIVVYKDGTIEKVSKRRILITLKEYIRDVIMDVWDDLS